MSPQAVGPSILCPAGSAGGFRQEHRGRLRQPGTFPAGEIPDHPQGSHSFISSQAEAERKW